MPKGTVTLTKAIKEPKHSVRYNYEGKSGIPLINSLYVMREAMKAHGIDAAPNEITVTIEF